VRGFGKSCFSYGSSLLLNIFTAFSFVSSSFWLSFTGLTKSKSNSASLLN
jgi:hypothetical protein